MAWLNINSKLWQVRAYNDALAHITQRASGATRHVSRSLLPSQNDLAAMSERKFDAIMRDLFHSAGVC